MKKANACPACLGTGLVQDQAAIGRSLRATRRVKLRVLAERMGTSAAHLCLLEKGKRRWTPELIAAYRKHTR